MATKTKKKRNKKTTKKKTNGKKTNNKRKPSAKKKQINRKPIIALSAAALAVILIAAVCIAFHSGGKRSSTIEAPDKEIAWGIDVSSHNGEIDWSSVKSSADFAFVRVGCRGYTEGEIILDKRFKENAKGANKNGVPIGVYFYSQAINEKEAEEEAKFVLEKIKSYDISLPVVIDFEYVYENGSHMGRLYDASLSKAERTSLINAFCDKIRKAGYTPGIYASSYIYASQLNMKDIDEDVFIWVADYNESVTYNGYYDIWQYSETGSCDGVSSKNVDMDYWYTKNRL